MLMGIVVLIMILILLRRRGYETPYLFFFSLFWVYLLFVFSAIIFPVFPMRGNYQEIFHLKVNFIPFYFGACAHPRLCMINIIGNILITVPLGFGLSFVARLRSKDFLWLPLLIGLFFELIQLMVFITFQSLTRVTDINDVILNALGIWVGYVLFRMFGAFYLFITRRIRLHHRPLFAYVHSVVRSHSELS